jgi:cytochrome c556
MNDDFLYRLRTEPPPHFAEALKARLDRSAKRTVRVWHFGLAALLFGAAFAMMSYWSREAPAPVVATPVEAQQRLVHAFSDKKAESPNASVETAAVPPATNDDAVKESVRALLDEERAKHRLPVTLAPLPSTSESSADASVDTNAQDAENAFIVTGPLLAEYGTPAYTFETRRAYFTVMEWSMKSLRDMQLRRMPIDRKAIQTTTYRLAVLTPMLPELFKKDERGSVVTTRAKGLVWEQQPRFLAESLRFMKSLKALMDATKSNDDAQVRNAIAGVDLVCSSCHQTFREGGDTDVGAVTP